MKTTVHLTVCAAVFALMALPVAGQVSRSQVGTAFQISHGRVVLVEETTMDAARTSAGSGAVMGGIAGALAGDDAEDAAKGAALGALVAGLVARHQKKNAPSAYIYSVLLTQGGETKIITDHGDLLVDDCVSVELGQTSNIRRVSDTFCDPDHQEILAHPDVHAASHAEAEECHAAKAVALDAQTEDEMDLALKKIRLFCES